MDHKSIGLLDRYIESQIGEECREIEYDHPFDFSGPDDSHLQLEYPNSYKLGQEDEEVRVRMRQGLAWAKFMCEIIGQPFQNKTGQFFAKSNTHRALFYHLFKASLDAQLNNLARGKQPDRVGVPQYIIQAYMEDAEGKSKQTCRNIIKKAIDLGLVQVRNPDADRRSRVLWLTPDATHSYLTTVLKKFDELSANGLPKARRDLLAAKEENPNFDEDVRDKIYGALKADKNTPKK
jgi:hypothetical protein